MMTPKEIVNELDKYIIGQGEAKKAVALALRNRYRRSLLSNEMQEEVLPKNILMIGPTGVGKTEIARRLARLVNAPFVKVEATKFTEVGYVGRDVESIVRDLVEAAVRQVRQEKMEEVQGKASKRAEERLVELLAPMPEDDSQNKNPLEMIFGMQQTENENNSKEQMRNRIKFERETLREKLARGEMEDEYVEIEVEEDSPSMFEVFSGSGYEEMGINIQDMLGNLLPKKKQKRRVTVKEARRILTQQEAQKLIDMEEVKSQAVTRVEEQGIVFVDEIDKIVVGESNTSADVSRGGVQRDILPIVEGSTVVTKYGPVKTDHILFIAAGAFHMSKPSDLIPELQGRFPIRVELDNLNRDNFLQILTEPKNSLIKQYTELLATEGLEVEFSKNSLVEIAKIAYTVNEQTENIGARRLHTIMEKLLEDLSFEAPEKKGEIFTIDESYVQQKLDDVVRDQDLSRYILKRKGAIPLRSLLEKTRAINKLLQKSAGYPVDYKEIAAILSENIDCSVYIIDRRGKPLGYNYLKDFTCEVMQEIVESPAGFPEEYNEYLLKINETHANFCQAANACVFDHETPCKFNSKVTTIVPIIGAGSRLGTLVLAKFEKHFTDEDLILAEYGATVVGMEVLRARADRMEEEARKRAGVQIALGTLSYSELDAVQHIFDQLDGDEGLLVASKIADRVGITRSVIVNALRKFESAGVIESKSLGMKGTYIKVLNDRLLEELERLAQH